VVGVTAAAGIDAGGSCAADARHRMSRWKVR